MNETLNDKFMRRAIELASYGMENGHGGPFGCVVVREGIVVGEGYNRVKSNNDPTAHAEVEAIRDACQNMETSSLEGSVIYTSCEPCPMCLAAIYWSGATKVYYGCSSLDAAKVGFEDQFIYEELRKDTSKRIVDEVQILSSEAFQAMAKWKKQP